MHGCLETAGTCKCEFSINTSQASVVCLQKLNYFWVKKFFIPLHVCYDVDCTQIISQKTLIDWQHQDFIVTRLSEQINIEFAKFNGVIIHEFKVKHIKHPMHSFLAENLCKIYDESDVSQKTLGKRVVLV